VPVLHVSTHIQVHFFMKCFFLQKFKSPGFESGTV
jgi:hypothetical protein